MDTEYRLQIYKSRLKDAIDPDQIKWLESEIDSMEAELIVESLLIEIGFFEMDPIVIETDRLSTIHNTLREDVIRTEFVWSWKRLTYLWRIEFYFGPDL